MRITFLHPDLGLGGAERLVVDAAVELQMRGHEVRICTTQHDPQRSFAETHDGTLAVRVGEPARRLPLLGGNARALQAIHAMRTMALATARRDADSDIYFCDLIAHAIPALRRRTRAKIVYFCHFPDKFLAPQRAGSLYRLYRNVLDHLEERGIAAADKILVNSHFTAERLRAAFPRLAARPTEVVYPGISDPVRTAPMTKPSTKSPWTVLTLNRFDPTKRHDRAIDAFAELRNLVTPAQFACLRLVVAGSCDRRLPEQVDTVARLRRRAERLGLNGQVQFRLSISDDERWRLLTTSRCLVYTPENEQDRKSTRLNSSPRVHARDRALRYRSGRSHARRPPGGRRGQRWLARDGRLRRDRPPLPAYRRGFRARRRYDHRRPGTGRTHGCCRTKPCCASFQPHAFRRAARFYRSVAVGDAASADFSRRQPESDVGEQRARREGRL